MSKCFYLDGENVAPRTASEARTLVGKRVKYLSAGDLDESEGGNYPPSAGGSAGGSGRNIAIDNPANFAIYMPRLREMVVIE